jgi:predicted amidohydrolase
LHADEEPFFVSGDNFPIIKIGDANVGFAICYELSIATHAQNAFKAGAHLYMVSAVKSVGGIDRALHQLHQIANEYRSPVLLANSIGIEDGCVSAGKSSVWSKEGKLIGQLDSSDEGLLIFDTQTNEITTTLL